MKSLACPAASTQSCFWPASLLTHPAKRPASFSSPALAVTTTIHVTPSSFRCDRALCWAPACRAFPRSRTWALSAWPLFIHLVPS